MIRPSPRRAAHSLRRRALVLALLASGLGSAQAQTFTWSTGTLVPGVTAPASLAAGQVLDITAGPGFKLLVGGGTGVDVTNGGTVSWTADPRFIQSGFTLVNNALWVAQSDDNLSYNGAAPGFTNNGTFRKSGGNGSTTVHDGVGFVNNGLIDAQTGTIRYVGGSRFNAGSVFSGAGVVEVGTGTNIVSGSFSASSLVLASAACSAQCSQPPWSATAARSPCSPTMPVAWCGPRRARPSASALAAAW